MPEHGFSLTRVFPHKDKIINSDLILENTGHIKPAYWQILRVLVKLQF